MNPYLYSLQKCARPCALTSVEHDTHSDKYRKLRRKRKKERGGEDKMFFVVSLWVSRRRRSERGMEETFFQFVLFFFSHLLCVNT